MYVNIAGIKTNLTQLKHLISQRKPLVVCLAESHITDDLETWEIDIEGYQWVSTNSSSKHTGGCIIYIKEEVKFKTVLSNVLYMNTWITGIEVMISKQKIYIFTVYHSPNSSDLEFLERLEEILSEWAVNKGHILLVGDFNINMARKSTYSNRLQDIIKQHCLYQLVDGFTRITPTCKSIIDLVITNQKNLRVKVHLTPKITDHSLITVQFDSHFAITELTRKTRNFKNFDGLRFQFDLMEQDWNPNSSDIDVVSDILVTSMLTCLDRHAPEKEIYIQTKWACNEWINEEIKLAISERDRKYRRAVITDNEEDWKEYRIKRNAVVSLERRQQREYYTKKIDSNRNKPQDMWKTIKKLLGKNKITRKSGIEFENELCIKDGCIADNFNGYFLSSINKIAQSCKKTNYRDVIVQQIQKIDQGFHKFQLVDMAKLRKIIGSMANKKSSTDGINTEILKLCFEIIGNRFLQVINNSLEHGTFPKKWKRSLVIPIEKKTNTIKHDEFRPINMVPSYEKLIEKVVHEQVMKYIESSDLLTIFQSGFRKNHCCESAIQSVIVNWKSAINSKKVIGVIFLDLKRAFETVDRELLMIKLERMGFGGIVLKWFGNYLSERSQQVKYGEAISTERGTTYGVPQGTVLGPVLFVLYINDIVKHVKRCKIQLFADDALLYVIGDKAEEVIKILNDDLVILLKWLDNNNMKVNISKTKAMIIRNKYAETYTDPSQSVHVYMNNDKIDQVAEYKYLGIIIDENLSFSSHAAYVSNKVARKVNMLRRIGQNLTQYTKHVIYQTIISPHFSYCSTVLFLLSKTELDVLQRKQNQALRTILKASRYTNIKSMLRQLNLLGVRQMIVLNTMVFIYKMLHGMLPAHLLDHCKFVRDVHEHNTRSCNDFYVSTVSTNYAQNDLFHSGLVVYNALPREVKECEDVSKFKKECRKYVVENVDII